MVCSIRGAARTATKVRKGPLPQRKVKDTKVQETKFQEPTFQVDTRCHQMFGPRHTEHKVLFLNFLVLNVPDDPMYGVSFWANTVVVCRLALQGETLWSGS